MARFMSLFAVLIGYSAVGGNILHTLAVVRPSLDATLSLKTQLNSIETRLTTLEQKSTSGDSRCSVRNIGDEIRKSNYRLAEQELIELNDDDLIPNIVHDVYAGSSANEDIILSFAKSLKSAETKSRLLSALTDEVRSKGNNDPLQLIVLAGKLERLVTVETKKNMQVAVQKIVEEIKTAAGRTLIQAMTASRFQNNDEVKALTTALYAFCSDVAKEVMAEVIDKVFGVVAAETIIDNIHSTQYIELVFTGLAAVINRFNFAGNSNSEIIVKLASSLEQLQQRVDYGYLCKDVVDKLIRQLPTCVRNLFFAKNVCLWNKDKNMYLYATDSLLNFDEYRRSIFMYVGDPKLGAYWAVERHGTEVYFRNVDYDIEYLYPRADLNNGNRYVHTWMEGNNKEPQSVWTVELYGDYCYLKSAYNDYLVAAFKKSLVFTSTTEKGVTSSDRYLWQLRNCSRT